MDPAGVNSASGLQGPEHGPRQQQEQQQQQQQQQEQQQQHQQHTALSNSTVLSLSAKPNRSKSFPFSAHPPIFHPCLCRDLRCVELRKEFWKQEDPLGRFAVYSVSFKSEGAKGKADKTNKRKAVYEACFGTEIEYDSKGKFMAALHFPIEHLEYCKRVDKKPYLFLEKSELTSVTGTVIKEDMKWLQKYAKEDYQSEDCKGKTILFIPPKVSIREVDYAFKADQTLRRLRTRLVPRPDQAGSVSAPGVPRARERSSPVRDGLDEADLNLPFGQSTSPLPSPSQLANQNVARQNFAPDAPPIGDLHKEVNHAMLPPAAAQFPSSNVPPDMVPFFQGVGIDPVMAARLHGMNPMVVARVAQGLLPAMAAPFQQQPPDHDSNNNKDAAVSVGSPSAHAREPTKPHHTLEKRFNLQSMDELKPTKQYPRCGLFEKNFDDWIQETAATHPDPVLKGSQQQFRDDGKDKMV
jgi:hypothetical protein